MTKENKMLNYFKKHNLPIIFFIFFVTAYTILLVINPQLGPTDDFTFLRTLQVGKPMLYYSQNFPYYDFIKLGRFTPIGAMEYNLFGLFSKSPSPFWYYFYHAIQFAIFAVLIVKLLSKFTANKFLLYGIPILLFLTPGFTISWFRMQINERNVIFFSAAFLLCYLVYLKNQKIIYLGLGLLFANLAIYYKETAFIAIGAFAFSHLLFSWKTANKKINPVRKRETLDPIFSKNKEAGLHSSPPQETKLSNGVKIFDGLLFLSSSIYIIIYYFFVWLNRGPNLYLNTSSHSLLVLAKNFLNYGLFSDPILILIILPLTIWRMYKVFIWRQEARPLCDSMLLTAAIYVAAFFALNMYGPYYLLPAYIFALPVLIYFFNKEIPKNFFWKTAGVVTGFILIFNVLPSGIHYLTYHKYLSANLDKTLNFLIQEINTKHPNERANIFLDGIDRDGGRGTYFIFAEFLQFKGLSSQRFDLKSKEVGDITPVNCSKIPCPFTVFQKDELDEIKSGDYLIVPPQGTKRNVDKTYLESLNKDYDLIFETKSPLAFPQLNLKTLIKYFLSERLSQGKKTSGVINNENLMDWPDYYVFVKK